MLTKPISIYQCVVVLLFSLFFSSHTALSSEGNSVQNTPSISTNPHVYADTTQPDAVPPPSKKSNPTQTINSTTGSFTESTAPATITAGNSVSCSTSGINLDNSYYRRFNLNDDFSFDRPFSVTSVDIGIETAASGTDGSQPIDVKIYSIANEDAFHLANLTLIKSVSFSQADTSLTVQNFPISGFINPATDDLVVELHAPDGQAVGHSFYIGSNALGQTAPSYMKALDCGIAEPTTTGTIGFPNMHIAMKVYYRTEEEEEDFHWTLFVPATTGAGH